MPALAVAGVAENAVNAEHKAQVAAQKAATEQDRERAALAQIPLPTKSLYENVQTAGAWANPFLSVNADTISLRTTLADASPGAMGQGTGPHPTAARHREVQLRPADLAQALIALPPGAWRYGRVTAPSSAATSKPSSSSSTTSAS